jgi:hypothetical protein
MAEAALVIAVIGFMFVLGLMAVLVPFETLVLAGSCFILLGFLLGVPAGTLYHVKLYRWLAANGGVPRGFFWHPTRYHKQVAPDVWRGILPWFTTGVVGFALIMMGCAIVMLSVWRAA